MSPASPPITIVDAFTDVPFRGNPAGVCLLSGERPDDWMQAVAAELNLSETAFLLGEGARWSLRWFTPTIEVDLCGHATLASAHVLWERELAPSDVPLSFETKSGELVARRAGEWIELDFPSLVPAPSEPPAGLAGALGAEPRAVATSRFDLLVELEDEAAVRALAPDLARIAALPARGVIVTAPADTDGVDFVSRFFAPQAGVPEDPVTGSAHCVLAPYWREHLDRNPLLGEQVSARGGRVRVEVADDRVQIGGKAVTVLRGELA